MDFKPVEAAVKRCKLERDTWRNQSKTLIAHHMTADRHGDISMRLKLPSKTVFDRLLVQSESKACS